MRRFFALLAVVLLAASGCAQAGEQKINMALWKLPMNVPLMAAIHDKTYEKIFAGEYIVRYIRLPSGPKQIEAMAAGELDIAEGLGAAAALVGRANGVELTIIGASGRSPRAFAIMASDPSIKSIKDLKGRKVAGLRGSVVHQLLVELLETNGLGQNDIEFFPMPPQAAASALLAGRVDAALLVGTEIRRAQKGGAVILADGRGRLSGLSVIAARTAFLEKHPEAVRKYLNARMKICTEIAEHPEKFVPIAANETQMSESEAREMMSWYDFNINITQKDVNELKKTIKYLQKEKLIRTTPDITSLLWRVPKN